MAKRKRTEPTDVIQRPREAEAKKVKLQHASTTKQKTSENAITKAKPAVREAEKPVTPTAVRIVTGSYEKVLAGVDVKFASNSGYNVRPLHLALIYSISSISLPYTCSPHTLAQSNVLHLATGTSSQVVPTKSSKYTTLRNVKISAPWPSIPAPSQHCNSTPAIIFSVHPKTGQYVFGAPETGNVWRQ